ncbi:MAG TPA: MBOAT family protein [Nitrococcus sp.]|nr:MBOAT family protein [Nitrococcus sp.]
MLFNSPVFLFAFLPLVLLGFYLIGRFYAQAALVFLLLASLFFYGWWNPSYLPLLLGSIVFNYTVGRRLVCGTGRWKQPRVRQALLMFGLASNLAALGYFKYFNFFLNSVNHLFSTDLVFVHIMLPLAISFFTFTQITYLVDAYRGTIPDYSPLHYALFVTFFPHLIAGPIVHHYQLIPQYAQRQTFHFQHRHFAIGASIFIIGLAKKVVIADSIALYATPVFDAANTGHTLTFFEAWGGALAYGFQLYFDFSGYSDMAIGLARMFGLHLPQNFNSPYKAQNIAEFWRRWHMTLSHFLRDYLYIPLGGNRRGPWRRHINLMVTMLLGGLWHGAAWTFVLWGGLHGLYLVVYHGWRSLHARLSAPLRSSAMLSHRLGVALTFLTVTIAWVPFRAESFSAATAMLSGMAGLNGFMLPSSYQALLGPLGGLLQRFGWRFSSNPGVFAGSAEVAWVIVLLMIALVFPNTQQLMSSKQMSTNHDRGLTLRWRPNGLSAVIIAAIATAALLSLNHVTAFLYFQF